MGSANRDRRHARRDVVQQFEKSFDAKQYDYARLVHPVRGKAKLVGVAVGFALYSAIFTIAWMGWSGGRVSYELFLKTTWVLILPATAIGVFAWLLAFNRLENKLRAPLTTAIAATEGETGALWRYAPLIQAVDPANTSAKTALNASREGRAASIDTEDYCNAVMAVRKAIDQHAVKPVATEVWSEVAENLEARQERAPV
jgi:hypothetical protein